jgi:hypothetical protein
MSFCCRPDGDRSAEYEKSVLMTARIANPASPVLYDWENEEKCEGSLLGDRHERLTNEGIIITHFVYVRMRDSDDLLRTGVLGVQWHICENSLLRYVIA